MKRREHLQVELTSLEQLLVRITAREQRIAPMDSPSAADDAVLESSKGTCVGANEVNPLLTQDVRSDLTLHQQTPLKDAVAGSDIGATDTVASEGRKAQMRGKLKQKNAIPIYAFQTQQPSQSTPQPGAALPTAASGAPPSFSDWSKMFETTASPAAGRVATSPTIAAADGIGTAKGSTVTPKGWNVVNRAPIAEIEQLPPVSLRSVFEEQSKQQQSVSISTIAPGGRTVLSPPATVGVKKQSIDNHHMREGVAPSPHPKKSNGSSAAAAVTPKAVPTIGKDCHHPGPQTLLSKTPTSATKATLTAAVTTVAPRAMGDVDAQGDTRATAQFALGDFLRPKTKSAMKLQPPITATAAPEQGKQKCAWGTAATDSKKCSIAESTDAAAVPKQMSTTSTASSGKAQFVCFSDIQKEEEQARLNSNMLELQGNNNPWFIQRRPRADSMEKLFQQQTEEKLASQRAEKEKRRVEEAARVQRKTHAQQKQKQQQSPKPPKQKLQKKQQQPQPQEQEQQQEQHQNHKQKQKARKSKVGDPKGTDASTIND